MAKDQTRQRSTVKQLPHSQQPSQDHLALAKKLFREAEQARYDHAHALVWARQDLESLARDVLEQHRLTMRLLERVGALSERYREHGRVATEELERLHVEHANLASSEEQNEAAGGSDGPLVRESRTPYGCMGTANEPCASDEVSPAASAPRTWPSASSVSYASTPS